MRELEPDELEKLKLRRGRRTSPLGELIRSMEIGQSIHIDTDTDEIKNPLSSYTIAKSVGRTVKLNKIEETVWILTRTK